MKKLQTIRSIQLSIFLAAMIGTVTAAPYGSGGRETKWVQPNGAKIQLRVFGDEYYGRTETLDGYTVVYNAADKSYRYALPSSGGADLAASAVTADKKAPAGLAKHLDRSLESISQIRGANRDKFAGDESKLWKQRVNAVSQTRSGNGFSLRSAEAAEAKIQAAPVVGTLKGLTILVQFPADTSNAEPRINFPTTRSKIASYCNDTNYTGDGNTGSIRDYFYDQSVGRLTYTQNVTPVVTLPRPWNYYNFADYPAKNKPRDDSGRVLLRDALEVLKAQNYDFSGLSTKNGNQITATNIFFAGPDSGVWSLGLWPHRWDMGDFPYNVGTDTNPKYVNDYQITNLENSSPVIGTFCHENGHLILGYPDLYDYDYDSQGVGDHCLMGGGSYNNDGKTPSPINAYFKDIVGWGNVVDISADEFKTVTLKTSGNQAYRIRKPGSSTEYFITENRGRGDKWATYSVDKGVAIWHIDETINGNNFQQMTQAFHYEVSLEQADGQFQLERNVFAGQGGDLFDLGRPLFTDKTTPNAKWWSGQNSSISIEVLGATGSSTQVLFGLVPPNTIILGSPNGGEILYPGSVFPINWKANIVGKVKIDLLKDGVYKSTIAKSEDNDGSYDWSLPNSLLPAGGYSVRISSLTNPIPTQDTSSSTFSVSPVTFPHGGVIPHGWFKPKGVDSTWRIAKAGAYEGNRCIVTETTGDGARSAIAYRSNFLAGSVSFYIKVSSENSFDTAKFYIDGVAQSLGANAALSGEVDWKFLSFPVSAGAHTFMWTFDKDDSYSGLEDKVWIDAVSMPATTQEIVVEKPIGVNHENGAKTNKFPNVNMGSTSKAQTFTIKNKGKADLHGIKITKSGTNEGEFEVRAPKKTALAPGQSTTFQVIFAPKSKGLKTAGITIHSNDEDEKKFKINVEGLGVGLPKIAVSQPADLTLKDADSEKKFGSAKVGSGGNVKIFTITNKGSAPLTRLEVTKNGKNPKDFVIGKLRVVSLAPGESTTFKVTFSPNGKDRRIAQIHIASNDKVTGRFDIKLSGIGVARGGKANAGPLAAALQPGTGVSGIVEAVLGKEALAARSVIASTEVVGGQKYRSLTITKAAGQPAVSVEVSSDLLDWYSGKKHTTILIDDASTLKVRDNTPVTPDSKRYIRLK